MKKRSLIISLILVGALLGLGPLEHHKYYLPLSREPRLLIMARKR